MKEKIKEIIKEFHLRKQIKPIDRNVNVPINSNKIITLIGPRRSGKTFTLYQTINKITKTKSITDIIYINFEDDRLELKKEELQLIIEAYQELYPEKELKETYFFFDEIQNVTGWEQFIRRINDSITTNIFLTGSSAKLLSKEIATSLRGRTISIEIYPLSFKEYLQFKQIETDKQTIRGKSKIKKEFEKYIQEGGFPEINKLDEEFKIKTIQNYLEVMMYRDIIERYNLKNITGVKYALKKFISNVSKETSLNKTYNELKSLKIKISKDSFYEYPKMFEDAFIIFQIPIFDKSFSKQELKPKKTYCIDTGIINATNFSTSEDKGRILENAIFIELKRRNQEIYYHKNKYECDFIIKEKEKITKTYQICYKLNKNNEKREYAGLIEAMRKYKLKTGIIITNDQEEEIKIEEKTIQIIPAWKWLLEK